MEKNAYVELIAKQIDECPKTQTQLAWEMGYPKQNIISMFKQGRTRVPMNKVQPLANALGADPVLMLSMWLDAYEPEAKEIMESSYGRFVTEIEFRVIEELRRAVTPTSAINE